MNGRYFLLLSVFVCAAQLVSAQGTPDKLNIPSTPAFSILDYEPTSVMRPMSTKDLAGDVLNSFDENGKLLMNLGLEVAPYWLTSHPGLRRQQYLLPDSWQSIKQSFSLSAATVRDTVSNTDKFGVGLRFRLLNGRPVDSLALLEQEHVRQLHVIGLMAGRRAMVRAGGLITTRQQALDLVTQDMANEDGNRYPATEIQALQDYAATIIGNYADNPTGIRNFLEALEAYQEEQNTPTAQRLSSMQEERIGFVLEFAGAGGFRTSGERDRQRIGLWLNASNYVSPDDLFTLTARYMYSNGDTSQNNFDVGLGFLKKAEDFNISLEGMLRWYRAGVPEVNQSGELITRLDKSFTYRLALQGSYAFTRDVSINISIGKEFDQPFIGTTGFFSIFGLNYAIFKPRKLPDPQ